MMTLPANLIGQLEEVAKIIAKQKPKLHLLALVQGIWPDAWSLVVSSDQLSQNRLKDYGYIDKLVKKHIRRNGKAKITRIVPLPPKDPAVRELVQDRQLSPMTEQKFTLFDGPLIAEVIWPAERNGKTRG
jgi:hypothetical protein